MEVEGGRLVDDEVKGKKDHSKSAWPAAEAGRRLNARSVHMTLNLRTAVFILGAGLTWSGVAHSLAITFI
jgi:hypothetical protein